MCLYPKGQDPKNTLSSPTPRTPVVVCYYRLKVNAKGQSRL